MLNAAAFYLNLWVFVFLFFNFFRNGYSLNCLIYVESPFDVFIFIFLFVTYFL